MLKPRSCTRFPTPVGTTIGWSAATRRRRAPIEMIEMRVGHEDEID